MYMATVSNALSKTGTKDEWTYFSSLPDGVNIDANSNIHLFPYKGDFCISVGTSVWRKRHRSQDDPILKQAVDNWPKMYQDKWEPISDKAFPAADLRDVVPFAVLDTSRNEVAFQLVVLNQNSSLQVLAKDDIYPSGNKWDNLSWQKNKADPDTVPVWSRIAYWNNSIVALDNQNNTWTLTVNFQNGTYTIGDKTPIKATSEFTATDIGPVAVQDDGYLYKRFVQDPPADGSEPQLRWTRWIAQDGVTHLGVAAPGVILDLQTLTQTLKARYIDAQTALYPVVNKIDAFAITHQVYLDQLLQAATDWQNAPDGSEKQAIAIRSGQGFVKHAKVWSKILSTSVLNTKTTVNIMTQQLHDVKTQLEIQLQLLRDKLTSLQNTLKAQKEALGKLNAAFWGAVGAMFLGMALGVLALATGVGALAVVGAGALFIAGFVAMVTLGVKISELAGQISDTQSQIRVTNTAITELSAVVQNFTDLDSMYGTLNVFWGRMSNNASSLGTMDNATAAILALDMFDDTSSVVAAQKMSGEMADAAKLYLDTLNQQGIHIPDDDENVLLLSEKPAPHHLALAAVETPRSLDVQLHLHVRAGRDSLGKGDVTDYYTHMERAAAAEFARIGAAPGDKVHSGQWYDISRISGAATLINQKTMLGDAPSDAAAIENRVNTATPVVVGMLQRTDAMCGSVQTLLAKYKALSAAGDKDGVAKLKDTLLSDAIKNCQSAQTYAVRANNAFADVNRACTDYQQGLERQVGGLQANGDSARASADQAKRNIDVPWPIYMGGGAAVLGYLEAKRREIDNDLNNQLGQINASIAALKAQQQSGAEMDGHSLTWIDMVKTVSGCLGSVYNILSAVFGQVLEDPAMYESLLSVEWANVQKNTQDVLSILASRGVNVNAAPSDFRVLRSAVNGVSIHGSATTNGGAINGASNGTANGLWAKAAPPPVRTGTAPLAGALDAPGSLGANMNKQAKQAQQFFAETDTLLKLPYLSGIVGYWDDKATDKASLLDVVAKLRRQYVDMMSEEYPVIETLFTTSLLQQTRAELVSEGRLELPTLVRSSLKSARSSASAVSAVANHFRAARGDYEHALKQIEANLQQIKTKMAEVDTKIGDLEKQERDKVIWLIADIVALSCATAALLIGFEVFGPLATALTVSAKIGLGAAATAAAVKLVIDGLGLADIELLLGTLRGTRRDLEKSLVGLQAVRPLFGSVVEGAEALEHSVDEMVDGLQRLQNDIATWKDVGLTEADVKKVGISWAEVKDSCTLWMDVVNAQGIVPS